MRKALLFALGTFLLAFTEGHAFFLTVVQKGVGGYGVKGEEVFWVLFRSEPFQGVLFDLRAPEAGIYAPGREPRPVALLRTKMKDRASGRARFVLLARYLPDEEGDFYLVLTTEPTVVPRVPEVWREFVKVPLHVGREGDWASPLGLPLEIVPLTRPYGLRAGASFSGRLLLQGEPARGVKVALVPYHGVYLREEDLPRDPGGALDAPSMYLATRTNGQGEFTVSLPHAGWWLITAPVPMGFHEIGREKYPLYWRASLWLCVKPPFAPPKKAPKLDLPDR